MRKIVPLVGLIASVLAILTWFGIEGKSHDDNGNSCASCDASSLTFVDNTSSTSTCMIEDTLGYGQVADAVSVSVGGVDIGTLYVDESSPTDSLSFTADTGQTYDYSIGSYTTVLTSDGEMDYEGWGAGTLTCSDGDAFALVADDSTYPWDLYLQRAY